MKIRRWSPALLVLMLACTPQTQPERATDTAAPSAPAPAASPMNVSSPAFAANGAIPSQYGCDGAGISPPLVFGGVPAAAKSVALIVEDPDAPSGAFTHWVVWNIAPTTRSISEGRPPDGAVAGTNGFGKSGWGGPCPPSGMHHYVFNLYALDASLNLPPSATSAEVKAAMRGHVVAQSQLVGTYSRSGATTASGHGAT